MKFSHSALEKYRTCPKLYNLHYNQRLRPMTIGSSLVFGNAMDAGFNAVLLTKKKELTPEEQEIIKKAPEQAFDDAFSKFKINGPEEEIAQSWKVDYSKGDFDALLLGQEEIQLLQTFEQTELEVTDFSAFYDWFRAERSKGHVDFLDEEIRLYQFINWVALRRKGHLMLKTYAEQVMPKIKEVLSVQRRIGLPNGEGDSYEGILDCEVIWEDGVRRVMDNKTSSRRYTPESVQKSFQLNPYSEETGVNDGGYIVLLKAPKWDQNNRCQACGHTEISRVKSCANKIGKKRCGGELEVTYIPRIEVQIVLDSFREEDKEQIFQSIEQDISKIKEGKFEPDYSKCENQYGRRCVMYNYCHGQSMDGLVKAPEREPKTIPATGTDPENK
jgi:hypothetical protein